MPKAKLSPKSPHKVSSTSKENSQFPSATSRSPKHCDATPFHSLSPKKTPSCSPKTATTISHTPILSPGLVTRAAAAKALLNEADETIVGAPTITVNNGEVISKTEPETESDLESDDEDLPCRVPLATLALNPAAAPAQGGVYTGPPATNPFGLTASNRILDSIERRVKALGASQRKELVESERLADEVGRFWEAWEKHRKMAMEVHEDLEQSYYYLEHVKVNLTRLAGGLLFD